MEVPLRKGKSDSAMIDYLTFTFGIETVYSWFPNEIIGDNQINPQEYSYNGVTVKYMHQIGQGHQNDEMGILEDTSFYQPIDLKDIPNEL